jgi:predicted nucleic acid-binding protein
VTSAVIDTSALVRLFVPDGPVPEGLVECIEAGTRGDVRLLAPELILTELGQLLRKKEEKSYLNKSESAEIVENVLLLPIKYVSHVSLIQPAIVLSRKNRLSVYDCLFLTLANSARAKLFSADERLLKS